jgi:predicted phosphoribosyltransferase
VGAWYDNFEQVGDDEVIGFLGAAARANASKKG